MMNKFELFREVHGLKQCIRCHAALTIENHHYYCDKCWRYNQLDKFTNELNRKCREILTKRHCKKKDLNDMRKGD